MQTDELKEQIFRRVAEMGTYSNFVPQQVAIGWVPFAIRNRYLFSHPDIVRLVVQGLAPQVSYLGVAALAGAETAGIPLAMALSLETGIPFAYIRKKPREHGDRGYLEGDVPKGSTVALVDDLMTSAASKQQFVANLEQEGYKVNSIVVIWDGVPPNSSGEEWLRHQGFQVAKLFTWLELAEGLHRHGFIPDELYPHYVDFIQHREEWKMPGEKWREYVRVLEKTARTVPDELRQWLES